MICETFQYFYLTSAERIIYLSWDKVKSEARNNCSNPADRLCSGRAKLVTRYSSLKILFLLTFKIYYVILLTLYYGQLHGIIYSSYTIWLITACGFRKERWWILPGSLVSWIISNVTAEARGYEILHPEVFHWVPDLTNYSILRYFQQVVIEKKHNGMIWMSVAGGIKRRCRQKFQYI